MKMGIGMGTGRGCEGGVSVGVGGDGRHSQPPPPWSMSPSGSNVPANEFSGASGSKTSEIRTNRGDPGVRVNLPNPHPQVEEHLEHDPGIFILFFVMSAVD
jgi:hypothetical protein